MKIEFVGGPRCGEVVDLKFLNGAVRLDGLLYRRRDRAFNLSGRHGQCYGVAGHRLYDHVYEQTQPSDS